MAISKVVFNNQTLIDITSTTATADKVLKGKYFHTASGERTEGDVAEPDLLVVRERAFLTIPSSMASIEGTVLTIEEA